MKTKQKQCKVKVANAREAQEIRETLDDIVHISEREQDPEAWECFKEFIISSDIWMTDNEFDRAWGYFLAGFAYGEEGAENAKARRS